MRCFARGRAGVGATWDVFWFRFLGRRGGGWRRRGVEVCFSVFSWFFYIFLQGRGRGLKRVEKRLGYSEDFFTDVLGFREVGDSFESVSTGGTNQEEVCR